MLTSIGLDPLTAGTTLFGVLAVSVIMSLVKVMKVLSGPVASSIFAWIAIISDAWRSKLITGASTAVLIALVRSKVNDWVELKAFVSVISSV